MANKLKSVVVFTEIEKHLKADESLAKKIGGIYQFQITGENNTVHTWTVDLKNGSGSVKEGAGEKPDCTISMTDDDFLQLMTGKLDGQTAFMQGKLKMKGNIALAMKLNLLSQKQIKAAL